MEPKQQLKNLPAMNDLLHLDKAAVWEQALGSTALKRIINHVLAATRQKIIRGQLQQVPDLAYFTAQIDQQIADNRVRALQPVINATGVILHTNLGRAKLAPEAQQALLAVNQHATNLEYDIPQEQRGDRYRAISQVISDLTGAEDALVVNNNAAAVMLVLSTLFQNKEVIISRGQMVEIGGSFRIPEIITATGGILKEVGTTNKTHVKDYQQAINENTGGILLVHTSNYKLIGFTETPAAKNLAQLAKQHQLPLVNDLGSGLLVDLSAYGLAEPTVMQELKASDLVMFSGDKLLGGPQAGIIAGKRKLIQQLKHNQLLRALRVDKATLAALTATLKLYQQGNPLEKIPVLRALTASQADLSQKAQQLKAQIEAKTTFTATVQSGTTAVGGGSLPDVALPTMLVGLQAPLSTAALTRALNYAPFPLIPRVNHDQVLLDMRTVATAELDSVIDNLQQIKF
ncbi:L-seryl-tRNA(Sec) selenium transferase [Loigolactobacillus rennini]|uniref:L-seryl-tRNA(Sec) selenium transferase n=1 Tax=Loigolactobacillus rennini DSM 20253 TaxID=1423796 RepID=A0A0R2CSE3_9LACO|nr:L-seryl-tRNA(Sec) selenium transferase [Loigolactobacillus rennini]KRM94705.1 selenocysteine synthase [Loigolactobacillus rennini DSM 20253]